jgi:hypothetical protein
MNYLWIYILVAFIVIGGCIIGWLISSSFQTELKSKFEKIAEYINAKVINSRIPLFTSPKIKGYCSDVPYEIIVISGSQYSPPDVRITFFIIPPFQLNISKRGKVSKISKKLGLLKGIKTGISDFDNKFFIKTDNETKCLDFLKLPEIRDIVAELYKKGWYIVFRKKYIELIKKLKPKSNYTFSLVVDLLDEKEISDILDNQKIFLSKLLKH